MNDKDKKMIKEWLKKNKPKVGASSEANHIEQKMLIKATRLIQGSKI